MAIGKVLSALIVAGVAFYYKVSKPQFYFRLTLGSYSSFKMI
jgi:hypothetical protein